MNFNLFDKEVKQSILTAEELMQLRNNNFQMITTILNNNDIHNWPQGKTMLGLCQQGNFITDDHDEDIGIMNMHYDNVLCNIVPILEQHNFTVIRITKNKSMITLMHGPRYIDLCFFNKDNNTIGYEQKRFPIDFYEKFQNKLINNFEYSIPIKYKEICKYSYDIIL